MSRISRIACNEDDRRNLDVRSISRTEAKQVVERARMILGRLAGGLADCDSRAASNPAEFGDQMAAAIYRAQTEGERGCIAAGRAKASSPRRAVGAATGGWGPRVREERQFAHRPPWTGLLSTGKPQHRSTALKQGP